MYFVIRRFFRPKSTYLFKRVGKENKVKCANKNLFFLLGTTFYLNLIKQTFKISDRTST